MAKKTKVKSSGSGIYYDENWRALDELVNMKHKDLQIACIVRGMESQKMVDSDHHKLVSWFVKNYDNAQDEKLITLHDIWVEEQLQGRGYKVGDIMMSPSLRLGATAEIEQMEKVKTRPPKENPTEPKKPKAKMDEETGVRQGTKKAMTFACAYKKMSMDDTFKQVKAAFPAAQEKSVKIWYKKALKEAKAK